MDWEFFWAGEGGRDNLLRERQEYLQAEAVRQASQQRAMAREMAQLRGDVDQRLNALTRAFQAYVALDDVRTALASFPDQARARRWAREDLDALLDKQPPSPRNDTPGYWLTPAVAAMRPDGTLIDELATIAKERDEKSSMLLWTTVRGILDAGKLALDDLPTVLKPENGWDARQATLFRATVEGTFGPEGMAAIEGVIADIVEPVTADDWIEWVSENAKVPLATSSAGLDWLEKQLEFPTETLSLEADGGRRDALMTVVESLINQGVGEEHQLMAKAAKLRDIVSNPQSAPALDLEAEEDADFAAYIARHDPLTVIRATAIDRQAPVEARRALWRAFKPGLQQALDATADRPAAPVMSDELHVAGNRIAVSTVGADEGDLADARHRINNMDLDVGKNWPAFGLAGGLTALAGALMMGFGWPTENLALGIAVIAMSLVFVHMAWRNRQQQNDAIDRRRGAIAELEAGVPSLTTKLQSKQQSIDEQNAHHRQKALELKELLP